MIPITALPDGSSAVIAAIASPAERAGRLAAFGLVPGTTVRVLQQRPALVIACDGTELALEPRIGAEIHVAP
ncbi:MAG TPA: FeoA family protein [Planctomycetota bacterium]|nr:FeoA family protein [Planctomycetota bacterium]